MWENCVWEKHCHRLAALGGFEFRLGPLQAKQHCGCWSFRDEEAGLWLTPLSAESAAYPSARRRQEVCSPAMCGAVRAPQKPTCSLSTPPRPHRPVGVSDFSSVLSCSMSAGSPIGGRAQRLPSLRGALGLSLNPAFSPSTLLTFGDRIMFCRKTCPVHRGMWQHPWPQPTRCH